MQANGDMLKGTPQLIASILKLGVPAAIAIFLVYMTARTLPQMAQDINLQRKATEEVQRLLQADIVKHEELLRMLQRVCSNTAKIEEDRQRCFDR